MNPAIFEMECNPAAFGNHNMVNPLRKSRCIECIKPHGFGGKPLEVVPMDAVVPTGVCGGAGKHIVSGPQKLKKCATKIKKIVKYIFPYKHLASML